ncbi:hypothetical protein AVEN_198298-1 [Araneus ventricosus]|uniref:Transcriptional coactivator p15 (PC4) C-terminal domain-containing protein n=1 Tax=Araneus ventricosus TaxID=182803 RepID=A0A4Y2JWX0_ARAVE|nr:hypothetical protein AVEN_198298-1 [Araneus ventricosus]
MKRTSSQPTTSATPAKKIPTSNDTDGFTTDSIPQHHYHLGEDNYAVVSDVINVHIRKYKTYDNRRILPTKKGVSFLAFVWESLSKEIRRLPLLSDSEQVAVIRDTLFLKGDWTENVPHISLQRSVTKKHFSRQFLPYLCLLTDREWDRLHCIRKKITESCKSLMFGDFF